MFDIAKKHIFVIYTRFITVNALISAHGRLDFLDCSRVGSNSRRTLILFKKHP